MKKKFYNGLLLVAMIFATVGSFVSCKDYNEDLYAELQGQLQGQNFTLTQRIDSLRNVLQGQIDVLQQAQDACKDSCRIYREELRTWVENNYVTKQEFSDSIASLAGKIADNETAIELLGNRVDSINNVLQVTDSILQLQIDSLNVDIDVLFKADIKLWQAIDDLRTLYKHLDEKLNDHIKDFNDHINDFNIFREKLEDIPERVDTLESDLAKTIQDVRDAHELAMADSIRIDALENELEALRNEHNVDIDSIAKELDTIKESVNAAVELANENLEKAKEYTNMLISSVVESIKQTNERIDATNLRVDQIEAAYQAADKELQNQIDDLKTGLEELEKRVAQNEKDIEELFGNFKDVDEALKQFITGILIQGTENPVIGSYSLPVNIQSNVLMSYYGYAGSYGVEFPTYYPRYYVRESETLSQKDIDMLGIAPTMLAQDGEAIVSGAGKIYVTVNPSNVNFEGQTLPIVNSIEEESGIKLAPLAYSDKKLTFGYTRSAANGLYEAEATLAPEDIEKVAMKFDFDGGEIKQTLKDVFNNITTPSNINVTQVANTVIDVLNQFNQKLDANALKATWTDSLGVTRSVYSQYNLATTAVKPLSYSFMKDANYTSFPGFDKMRNFAGKLVDKVANKVKVVMPDASTINLSFSNLEKISFEAIEIDTEGIDVTLQYDTIINIPGGVVTDEYGNIIGEYDDTNVDLWITMEPDSFKDLLKEIEILEDDINNMLNEEEDAINKIIDQINSYLDELGKLQDFADQLANIDNKVDETATDVKNKIIEYLDKIENKLLSAVNSANKALQPVLLVKTVDGVQRVSQTIYEPTWMSAGDVQFVPTSYTAELIAPSYKKLVGVTNVYSMDRSKNAQDNGGEYLTALNEANSKAGVAEVLDGNTLVVDFTAEKGYIYEVTYTSVDYSGMVVAKKFYVTVK